MQIKFKPIVADAEYNKDFEEYLANAQKETPKPNDALFLQHHEVWVDNKFIGYISTIDYEHKASKGRMLLIHALKFKRLYTACQVEAIFDEFVRKNKKYYEIYMWIVGGDASLTGISKIGAFMVNDPMNSYFTKDYTKPNLLKLGNKIACILWLDGDRLKGSELDV